MRRLILNARLTVADKQVVLAMADAGASTAAMAAAVGAHPATIKRLLVKVGASREHGGSRGGIWATGEEGAGQTGKGSATSAERIELTPEMVWVDALARIYGLGMSDEQYAALVGAFPALREKGKRKSPEERFLLLHEALEDFYPRLVGKKLGRRDMGEDVLSAFNSSYLALRSEMPVQPPIDDASTLAAWEEQVAVGEMGSGTRVVRRFAPTSEAAVARSSAAASFWDEGTGPPPSETPVTAAPHARSKKFEDMLALRSRQKEAGTLEALEKESGVIRIDPQRYLAERALRDELEAMRAEGRIKSLPAPKHIVVPALPPIRNPDVAREDAASTALAMLRLSGSVMPAPRKARKKKPKKARPSRAAFRRLMRL